MRTYLVEGSCDCSYALNDEARFRVNIFRQQGHFSIVMRKLKTVIPTLQTLGLPPIFSEIAKEKTGLVLVTGATGQRQDHHAGCALERDQPNPVRARRHSGGSDRVCSRAESRRLSISANSATISRIIRADLRAALRQAPKVILVGEMRDRATVEVALMAAETGHLVLSTLHTIDAGQSINRILGLFSLGEEQQLRIRLADTLRYIVSQRLAPKVGGGRQLLTEIMGNNLRTQETIALGEGDNRSFYEIIEASSPFGWITFDQSILNAYEAGAIREETARSSPPRKAGSPAGSISSRKRAGSTIETDAGLRLDLPANAFH